MNRGFPSMTALLGLVAVAGYQNRDKIAEWLGGGGQPATPAGAPPRDDGQGDDSDRQGGGGQGGGRARDDRGGGLSGVLAELGKNLGGGATSGGILSGGLGELLDRFKQSGQGDTAESWVRPGPNRPLSPEQLERAIGPETLDSLSRQTGLPQQELLARLSRELPDAVDKYTPQGRLPAETEFSR